MKNLQKLIQNEKNTKIKNILIILNKNLNELEKDSELSNYEHLETLIFSEYDIDTLENYELLTEEQIEMIREDQHSILEAISL